MRSPTTLFCVLLFGFVPFAGCQTARDGHRAAASPSAASTSSSPVAHAAPAPPVAAADPIPPNSVDLRPRLTALGLTPRPQGARGTCSIFTTCESIEFALAARDGSITRLSPEFVNWAAGQAAGRSSDGNFFHNALAGFERYGVCRESDMPYTPGFDAGRAPSAEALAEAARVRDGSRETVHIRWIVPWTSARFGVNDEQFAEIKRVLATGFPVAAGSGHSRLLVGYRDDPALAGGGAFLTEDSALNRFDEVTYEFVRKQVADVFWVEAMAKTSASSATSH